MKTKFIDYMKYCIAQDIEFDAVIGYVDMPATFCFCDGMKFTDYCMEKYGDLLNSDCEVTCDPTGGYPDAVIVDYNNDVKGEKFTLAVAGYVSEDEYEKLFGIK